MIEASDIWAHLDSLAKPRRSLGRLESLAVQLALTQQRLDPDTTATRLILFAADHGVAEEGVSAWPAEVTRLMVEAIIAGQATSNAFANAQGCALRLVDLGVRGPRFKAPEHIYRYARVAEASHNLAHQPALSLDQFEAAWNIGAEEAREAVHQGARVLIAGEMGIANTTPAACITALVTGIEAEQAVGRGAGADDAVFARKLEIVAGAVRRARSIEDGRSAIASIAGLEIVAMAGFFAQAARSPVTLLIDGYVATAAALIAEVLAPGCRSRMIAAHRSAEPGHKAALDWLRLDPVLDWGMRLGEGTGALVALPLLDSAAALLKHVAPLHSVGARRAD